MDKKLIRKLVDASYSDKRLDKERVEKIASYLSQKELKAYIKQLKNRELERTVQIDSARPITDREKDAFVKRFSEKKVLFETNLSLLLGYRIRENDIIYDMNLSDTLHDIEQYLNEQYD